MSSVGKRSITLKSIPTKSSKVFWYSRAFSSLTCRAPKIERSGQAAVGVTDEWIVPVELVLLELRLEALDLRLDELCMLDDDAVLVITLDCAAWLDGWFVAELLLIVIEELLVIVIEELKLFWLLELWLGSATQPISKQVVPIAYVNFLSAIRSLTECEENYLAWAAWYIASPIDRFAYEFIAPSNLYIKWLLGWDIWWVNGLTTLSTVYSVGQQRGLNLKWA